MGKIRIGQGYDVHAVGAGDGLILGGVRLPTDTAFVAHSDGDVLLHALCDALLGALARGDIGQLFPDDNIDNLGRDSREFLCIIKSLMIDDGYRLGNADITIIAQTPKMAPYLQQMKTNISTDLETRVDQINIKATTTEKLGYIGREEGIAVQAVVLLEQAQAT